MTTTQTSSDRRSIAQAKLGNLVTQGRTKAAAVINKVMTEVPEDRLIRAHAMKFEPAEQGVEIIAPNMRHSLHRNAIYQVSAKAGIPVSYVDELTSRGPWGAELLSHNLNQLFNHQEKGTRYLVRSVAGQARGFLSDKYRRLDSRPIVEAFAASLQDVGALPYDGYALETRVAIQAIMPQLFEPIPGEIIAFGGALENSDFGTAALSFRSFILRLVCINGAIGQDMMRTVHLGKRLADDVVYSSETYSLDTKATVSAIRDTVRHVLGRGFIDAYLDSVRGAAEDKVTPASAAETLKKYLNKGQVAKVLEAYNGADVEMLPQGNNVWRLSNAISWVAGQTENQDEKLDLQKVAGQILPKAA